MAAQQRYDLTSIFSSHTVTWIFYNPRHVCKNHPHRPRNKKGKTAIINKRKKFITRSALSKNSHTPPFRPLSVFFLPLIFLSSSKEGQTKCCRKSLIFQFFLRSATLSKACLLSEYNASVLKLKITANLCFCEPVPVLAEYLNKYEGFLYPGTWKGYWNSFIPA